MGVGNFPHHGMFDSPLCCLGSQTFPLPWMTAWTFWIGTTMFQGPYLLKRCTVLKISFWRIVLGLRLYGAMTFLLIRLCLCGEFCMIKIPLMICLKTKASFWPPCDVFVIPKKKLLITFFLAQSCYYHPGQV